LKIHALIPRLDCTLEGTIENEIRENRINVEIILNTYLNFMRMELDKTSLGVIIFFSAVMIVSGWSLATLAAMFKSLLG
jgi:hypothetical protein